MILLMGTVFLLMGVFESVMGGFAIVVVCEKLLFLRMGII